MNRGAGESMKMVDDKAFFKLMLELRKRLQAKLVDKTIPEKSLNVIRICLDQITRLLQKSRLA